SAPFKGCFAAFSLGRVHPSFAKEGSRSLSLLRSKLTHAPSTFQRLHEEQFGQFGSFHSHCMDIELSIRGRFGERRSDTGQLLLPSGAIGLGRSRIRMWPDSLKLILLVYSTKSPPYSRPLRCAGMR